MVGHLFLVGIPSDVGDRLFIVVWAKRNLINGQRFILIWLFIHSSNLALSLWLQVFLGLDQAAVGLDVANHRDFRGALPTVALGVADDHVDLVVIVEIITLVFYVQL